MKIQISGIRFSSAHFVEIDGVFEGLHGHNFSVSAEVEGIAEDGLVMDFRELQRALERAVAPMDHRVLIPKNNPALSIETKGDNLEIVASGKRYRFPERDSLLLPIRNSTAEEMARLIYRDTAALLPPGVRLSYVSVEESEGSRAVATSP